MKFTITDERTKKEFRIKGKKELYKWINHLTENSGFEDGHECTERSTVQTMLNCFRFYANYSYSIKLGWSEK